MTVDTRNIHMAAIDKAIVNAMQKFVDEDLKEFSEFCSADVYRAGQNSYGVNISMKNGRGGEGARFIELEILQERPIVKIDAIVTPFELAHNGLGKRLISALFQASEANGHALVIAGLVPSFMRRLLKRGARAIGQESVQITSSTNLLS